MTSLRTIALLALALLGVGCSVDGLQFSDDHRVAWVTEDRSTVTLPFTLEWEVSDYDVTGPDGDAEPDAGYFAVFVDRSPQGRNQPLTALAEDDETCQATAGCPDLEWFQTRQVYVVESGTSVTIEQLPSGDDLGGAEFHDFTLVLLDGQGRRQGESSYRIRLAVERDA